jgi:hypothetical protein
MMIHWNPAHPYSPSFHSSVMGHSCACPAP